MKGRLVGLVSPHAGLHYSGPVAAYGYSLLRGREAVSVVLVGPSHRAAFEGVAVHASGGWETPLGVAPIDEELAAALVAADATLFDDPGLHRDEHSLEMQMPFLQRADAGAADRADADGDAVARRSGGPRRGPRPGAARARGVARRFERPVALPAGRGREPPRRRGGRGRPAAWTPTR